MKKVFGLGIFLGLSLGVGVTTFAQDNTQNNSSDTMNRPGTMGKVRGKRGGSMGGFKNLNLTEQQKEEIKKIRQSNRADQSGAAEMRQLMQARRSGTLTADQLDRLNALREQRRADGEKINQQIQAVLTAEQRAQLTASKQNRANVKGTKGVKAATATKNKTARGEFANLNLTDAQKQQIADLRKNRQVNSADRQELRQLAQAKRSGTLTAEQQDRLNALRNQMKTNGENIKDQIAAILTPEQRQQMEQNKSQKKARRKQQRMQNAPMDNK